MADRIEVGFKVGIRDALGEKTKKRIIDNLALAVEKVATIEVYTIAGELTAAELQEAAAGPLSDPVIQEFSINRPLAKNFDWLIEVGFRPGCHRQRRQNRPRSHHAFAGRKYRLAQNQRLYIPPIFNQRQNFSG